MKSINILYSLYKLIYSYTEHKWSIYYYCLINKEDRNKTFKYRSILGTAQILNSVEQLLRKVGAGFKKRKRVDTPAPWRVKH